MDLGEVLAYRWDSKPWEWVMSSWDRCLRKVPRSNPEETEHLKIWWRKKNL